MSSKYVDSFFTAKRPWSRYKDAILTYYLKPYLAKVKKLGKPLCVVDMFAGRGRFESGEVGSPLLIAEQLKPLSEAGVPVQLLCIEEQSKFFPVLQQELSIYPFAEARHGNCVSMINEIAERSNHVTTFLYIDPCDACQLRLEDLAKVYSKIQQRSSVEVLMVFMARAFLRQAAGVLVAQKRIEQVAATDPMISQMPEEEWGSWVNALHEGMPRFNVVAEAEQELSAVVGGQYWKEIVSRHGRSWEERLEDLVAAYCAVLKRWFNLSERFPIHADQGDRVPKYWMVFGSRYPPALDLFNRAACNARRKQGIAYQNEAGSLFAGVKTEVAADPAKVDAAIAKHRQTNCSVSWDRLRWRVCEGQNLGRFTDTEIDKGIQRAIDRGLLRTLPVATNGERLVQWADSR